MIHPRRVCHRLAQNDHGRSRREPALSSERFNSVRADSRPLLRGFEECLAPGAACMCRWHGFCLWTSRWYMEEQKTRRSMMITRTANWSRRQIGLGKVAMWVSLLWIAPAAIGADQAITSLQTGKAKYKNVIVTDRNATNIYNRHDGGIGNVKIGD